MQKGDVINLLIESSIAGGYWYDLRRFMSIGKPSEELQQAYAIAKEAREIMAANLKPGSLPGAALEACDEYLKSKGCPPEGRVAGHGQGLDLVERPVVRKEETCKLQEGMVISLHPTAKLKSGTFLSLADTYVVGKNGCVPLYSNIINDTAIHVID
jgi:Xaa-Pro aminopeptidase